ncbi:hypothetical protein PHYSODRAFT_327928 [Phytophthora sojae]|uniref:Uncharacterized protein n=1 Tax=Phytophthora sojae (strain P6497) TaxID=1094619 RepID=G4Z8W5_PHYSP|nr:hypothetical protein PHYSODRAFT_327928 [Phytophthora sojae]EGZ19736.1 hypothetical protein PHYSODRAFT_327928 [Phytophthora sojae]|eukprot:XP_009522453.1 hypothetical protein PHYSODRAFT_327928 [Phytophthora sojae]
MASDVSARVHLDAEKLTQKSADAQRKGNENAARALATSVADLREAVALLAEQRYIYWRVAAARTTTTTPRHVWRAWRLCWGRKLGWHEAPEQQGGAAADEIVEGDANQSHALQKVLDEDEELEGPVKSADELHTPI